MGKAKNLRSRVSSYFTGGQILEEKTRLLVEQIDKIRITVVDSELEALLLEAFYIQKYLPKYNIRLTDNKSYPYVSISLKDPFPKVLIVRSSKDRKVRYFGPYPNARELRLVLKTIRKIFPYQSVQNHPKRVCLYHHLGLCPCPPVFSTASDKKEYRRNIRGVIAILEGKSKSVMQLLEKKRDIYSQTEAFEEALKLQRKIYALSLITKPFRKPLEYDLNPNLREDIRRRELEDLREALSLYLPNTPYLRRLECYDISNISGGLATGSMVVFTDGEKDSQAYRRFKIRRAGKPNDFAMIREMLSRRLKHPEWEFPSLFIIDGGKGQVSSALSVLEENDLDIPLVGLAKRDETIVIPQSRDGGKLTFKELSLSKHSGALQAVMRIRDEAHRFAITYHRNLRSKHATG